MLWEYFILLLYNNDVVGVIQLVPLKTDDSGQKAIEIKNIAVRPEMRGRGYARSRPGFGLEDICELHEHKSSRTTLSFFSAFKKLGPFLHTF